MMMLQVDTVQCIPDSRVLLSFSTVISYPACHYHLRIKFPDSTFPIGEASRKLWVLLTRHVTDTKKNSDYIALRVESEFDRSVSQQKIDQIAEAVSGTGLMPTWMHLSGVGHFSGLIHQFDACVGELSRFVIRGPVCWVLTVPVGASIGARDTRRLAFFDRLIRWGGGGSRIYDNRVLHDPVTLVGRNPNQASIFPQGEDHPISLLTNHLLRR